MARKKTGQKGVRVNLYIPKELRDEAQNLAADRYEKSLSALVVGLLAKEIQLKRGLLKQAAA